MSTFTTVTLPCPTCGVPAARRLVESANAARHPAFRAQILDGTFQRFVCGSCGGPSVYERELLYTDLPRGQLIGVFPSDRRGEGTALEPAFRRTMDTLAAEPGLRGRSPGLVRLVFGYPALREKLVAADAGLDDRAVEALKLLLLARTGWARSGSRGLLLVEASADTLVFEHVGVTDGGPITSAVPRAMVRLEPALLALLPLPPDALWVDVARIAAAAA